MLNCSRIPQVSTAEKKFKEVDLELSQLIIFPGCAVIKEILREDPQARKEGKSMWGPE